MLASRILSRIVGTLLAIALAMGLLEPLAAGADAPIQLARWQEDSVLAALQDPSVAVRSAAIIWLSDKQTSNPALATAVASYLHKDQPASLRKGALQILGHMGPSATAFAPQIAALLADSDNDVREAAATALRSMGPAADRVAPQVAALLKDRKHQTRFLAVELLGEMGPAGARFARDLAALLDDPAGYVAAAAAAALINMGPAGGAYERRIAPLLVSWIHSHAPQLTWEALNDMGQAGTVFIPQVAPLLKSPDPEVRADTAMVLGHTAGLGSAVTALAPQVAPLLQDRAQAPDGSSPRVAAANALGRMGAAGAAFARQIAALLKDSDSYVRYSAAQALGTMGAAAAAAAPELATLLKDPEEAPGSEAAESLGHMGRGAAAVVPWLTRQLQNRDPELRQRAVTALSGLGPAAAAAIPWLARQLRSSNPDLRADAAKILGAMGSAAARLAPQLAALLQDPAFDPADAAASALGHMGSAAQAVVPQVAAMLQDPEHQLNAVSALDAMGSVAAAAAPELVAVLSDIRLRDPATATLRKIGPAAAPVVPQLVALLKRSSSAQREAAAQVLGSVGPAAAGAIPELTALLGDSFPTVRAAAAAALGDIGLAATASAPRIAALLADPDSSVRDAATHALDRLASLGPLQDPSVVLYCLSASHVAQSEAARFLVRAYLYREVDRDELTLIRWLGNRGTAERSLLGRLHGQHALALLQTFRDTWAATQRFPSLRQEIAEAIAELAPTQRGKLDQLAHLEELRRLLAPQFPAQALAVQAVLDWDAWYLGLYRSSWMVGAHLCAWVLLLFAYPRWRWVQSFFFWNRWARRFLGLFYVGLLITWVPWLRRRMLAPFKETFLPRRILEQLNEGAYFPDSVVLMEKNRRTEPGRLPVKEVLGRIRGQVVLKGQSGLGKTLLLLRLAVATEEPVVFLRATECSGGVVAAIQKKVQGQLRDAAYLRALIYAGALKVLIDGLNEAAPDARTRITQFVEEYFKGDFILTTQPSSWEPPATARVYVLQPLLPEHIQPFLLKQWNSVKERASIDQEQYERAVRQYLDSTAQDAQALLGLSNPMDASLAAELLARGESPDVFRLVEQRYRVMAEDFREREGRDFRLEPFSERVYEWRCSGEPDIHIEGFEPEVAALVKDRLMIQRTELITKKTGQEEINRWFFRHDRIMELFLLPTFMGAHSQRRQQHDLDEQLWGVYELLAVRLPDEEEEQLHQFLIERSADTKRTELLNRYTRARRLRTRSSRAPGETVA